MVRASGWGISHHGVRFGATGCCGFMMVELSWGMNGEVQINFWVNTIASSCESSNPAPRGPSPLTLDP